MSFKFFVVLVLGLLLWKEFRPTHHEAKPASFNDLAIPSNSITWSPSISTPKHLNTCKQVGDRVFTTGTSSMVCWNAKVQAFTKYVEESQ